TKTTAIGKSIKLLLIMNIVQSILTLALIGASIYRQVVHKPAILHNFPLTQGIFTIIVVIIGFSAIFSKKRGLLMTLLVFLIIDIICKAGAIGNSFYFLVQDAHLYEANNGIPIICGMMADMLLIGICDIVMCFPTVKTRKLLKVEECPATFGPQALYSPYGACPQYGGPRVGYSPYNAYPAYTGTQTGTHSPDSKSGTAPNGTDSKRP
ncbi:hypothetical protein PFISCL1PPCAC_1214, partial [Pristionchus fissidentatus]